MVKWVLIVGVALLLVLEVDAAFERARAREQARKRNMVAVLAALSVGPARAFELSQRVREITVGNLSLEAPALFAALDDLQREGLVARFEVERQGRSLRYYKLRDAAEEVSAPRGAGDDP